MQSILDAINEWIKDILIGSIQGNLEALLGDVNEKVGTIAAEVGKTPQGWNGSVFSMIKTLSENVIVPIAGLVITYVLCYELISMIIDKNNLHELDTFMFFKSCKSLLSGCPAGYIFSAFNFISGSLKLL